MPPPQPMASSLGDFGKLSREVRDMIWSHFNPIGFDSVDHRAQKTDLRILQTSREIYHEVRHVLYRKRTLFFNIFAYTNSHSWMIVYDKFATLWMFRSEEDFIARGFGALPYALINVCVNIHAPRPSYVSETLQLWTRVYALFKILRRCSSLRLMTIKFRGRWERTWEPSSRGLVPHSLLETAVRQCGNWYPYQVLLFPFLSLKDIAEDVIVKPDPSDAGGLADLYNAVMNLESGSVDPKENGSLKDEVLGLVVRVNPVADELMKALAERQSGFRRRHRRTVSEE